VSRSERLALQFRAAVRDDAIMVAYVRGAAASALTERHGRGPWSSESTERGVLAGFRDATIVVALAFDAIVGTFRLASRKPWAIDRAFFTPAERPLYLTDMAVHPRVQRSGVGRALLSEAERLARAYPADAIWLDAYDADAGAGPFYERCGYAQRGRKTYRAAPLVYFERRLSPTP
jgi:ribosomal protein S18 acetylase RimI-like enzyme